jgi:transposase-like protein
MDYEPTTITQHDRYLCDDCGASLCGSDLVHHRWIEWTPGGMMPCGDYTCPACGSDLVVEAHECNNEECDRHAREGDILCEECYDALVKKYLAFVNGLTPAEQAQVDAWMEDHHLMDMADRLRKSGEWLDSRL